MKYVTMEENFKGFFDEFEFALVRDRMSKRVDKSASLADVSNEIRDSLICGLIDVCNQIKLDGDSEAICNLVMRTIGDLNAINNRCKEGQELPGRFNELYHTNGIGSVDEDLRKAFADAEKVVHENGVRKAQEKARAMLEADRDRGLSLGLGLGLGRSSRKHRAGLSIF